METVRSCGDGWRQGPGSACSASAGILAAWGQSARSQDEPPTGSVTALRPLPAVSSPAPSPAPASVSVEQLAERLRVMEETNKKLAEATGAGHQGSRRAIEAASTAI